MRRFRIDDEGITLPAAVKDGVEVRFDGRQVWSFLPDEHSVDENQQRYVPWHREVQRRLDGVAVVALHAGGALLHEEEVEFGHGEGQIDFVDRQGRPVMIDKWGLVQRPFAERGDGVVGQMIDVVEQIADVLREDPGIEVWLAFGSLLGAVRSGGVIGHDSDIDLAYLSERETPAEMAMEMYAATRALRRAGLDVLNKSASFITVLFSGPDGVRSSIDIYTCFHIGDTLHETATVREIIPPSAVVPTRPLTFEGRELPGPADPERLLEASYGPQWRVPDPAFTYHPDPGIKARFDPWFGNLMRQRRAWERSCKEQVGTGWKPSSLATEAGALLEDAGFVVDAGAGRGTDALHLAAEGKQTHILDYLRSGQQPARRRARRMGLPVQFHTVNFYDLRDVLTSARLFGFEEGKPLLLARGLLDSLADDGVENFWRFTTVLMSRGGRAIVEFSEEPHMDRAVRWPRTVAEVTEAAERSGARVEGMTPQPDTPKTWHMQLGWVDQQ